MLNCIKWVTYNHISWENSDLDDGGKGGEFYEVLQVSSFISMFLFLLDVQIFYILF